MLSEDTYLKRKKIIWPSNFEQCGLQELDFGALHDKERKEERDQSKNKEMKDRKAFLCHKAYSLNQKNIASMSTYQHNTVHFDLNIFLFDIPVFRLKNHCLLSICERDNFQ